MQSKALHLLGETDPAVFRAFAFASEAWKIDVQAASRIFALGFRVSGFRVTGIRALGFRLLGLKD